MACYSELNLGHRFKVGAPSLSPFALCTCLSNTVDVYSTLEITMSALHFLKEITCLPSPSPGTCRRICDTLIAAPSTEMGLAPLPEHTMAIKRPPSLTSSLTVFPGRLLTVTSFECLNEPNWYLWLLFSFFLISFCFSREVLTLNL